LQKAIKDVDLEQNDKTQQLQKFQGEMSIYTQSVNNEIKTYTERIAQAREKWAEESAKYQADLNRYSGEIQQNVQQTTNDARNAQQYMTAANTYFTMAMNDIKTVLATVPNVKGG
jgi:predicted  nucleic acid-binding Zn-ribbon protein